MKGFGAMVRTARKLQLLSVGELGAALGMSGSLITKIEGDRPGPSVKSKKRVAEYLKIPYDVAAALKADGLDLDTLEPSRPEIPTFALDVAAGEWVETDNAREFDVDDPREGAIVEQGIFRVRISGDSMSPKWKSGETVEFQLFRFGDKDDGKLEVGKSYYVHKSDNTATFKQLAKIRDGEIVLCAINKKKYPKPMVCAIQEIARIARAVGVFDPR